MQVTQGECTAASPSILLDLLAARQEQVGKTSPVLHSRSGLLDGVFGQEGGQVVLERAL